MKKKIKIARNSEGQKSVALFRVTLRVVADDPTKMADDERRYREMVMHYRE